MNMLFSQSFGGISGMGRSPTENIQARIQQRANILAAARYVFARKGRAATMADIATQARISQGLAYRYFTGKEHILTEVLAETQQSVGFEQFLSQSGTPVERLAALVEHVLRDPGELALSNLSHGMAYEEKGSKELRELGRRRQRALHAIIRQLVIEGQRMGEVISGNPDRLTLLLRATLGGLRVLSLDEAEVGTDRLPSADMILRGIRSGIRRHPVTPAVPMPPSRTDNADDDV